MDRQALSNINHQIGIFQYAAELERHSIQSPTQQIVLICRFVERELGRIKSVPDLRGDRAAEIWIRDRLTSALSKLQEPDYLAEPLHEIFFRVTQLLDWDPYVDFAELLHQRFGKTAYGTAISKLRHRGFDPYLVNLFDLTAYFVESHLPRALRSFDLSRGIGKEEAFLSLVFYRFGLKQLIADRLDRNNLEFFEVPESFVDHVTPEQLLLSDENRRQISRLREELERLPDRERTAVKLYFGLSRGPERAQWEIARELDTTEYLARTLVVRGLQVLAARLGIDGPLDAEEARLLHLLVDEALPLRLAAEKLGVDPRVAKEMASRISRKFRIGLRIRTRKEKIYA